VARDTPFGAALSFLLTLVVAGLLFAFRKPLRTAT
jgi:ABC-type spermidine/putrescine transport system permease subunit I